MNFYVHYRTTRAWVDMTEHTAGPYSADDIHYQAQDIASYAGVYDVRIESRPDAAPATHGVAELNLGQPVGD